MCYERGKSQNKSGFWANAITQGPVECREVPKTMVIDNPVEECEMNPIRTCKFVTRLVPKLAAKVTCIDVPKEICSKSKGKPRRVKKPVIKKWCFKPENKTESAVELEPETQDCSQCGNGLSGVCDIANTPYTQCKYCEQDVCVTGDAQHTHILAHNQLITCIAGCQTDLNCPQDYQCYNGECRSGPGKVLLNSITIKTASCDDCGQEGAKVSLSGEVIGGFLDGFPCSTNTLNHVNSLDFLAGSSVSFDGHQEGEEDEVEKKAMGACFKVI